MNPSLLPDEFADALAQARPRLGPLASRVQWFDQQGAFLGQFEFGGQFYNVTFAPNGDLWGSTHPKSAPLDAESNIVRIDRTTGRLLGRIEVRAHELAIAPDGTLLPATRSSVLVRYRLAKTP